MNQSVLVNADIYEGAEVGDIGYNTRQFHAFVQVFYGLYAAVKLKLLNLFTRIATRLLQLLHDVCQGGQADLFADVLFDVYL